MNAKVALFTGIVTTGIFLFAGVLVYSAGHPVIGGILAALGLFRGVLWLRQLLAATARDED